ncbi:M81 family metallopeptidase [Luteolibacter pohnpeiensis]|uniref:M81 family metallopeptidase n=1 Tax=Luteolibacter pohnpeiensis TaxID=454153 RepID=A0A934VWF3_9BACT|nr:M81 family metallopeptidase [Luteolibacter pohnpeiensis]MBK1882439.1 M81 family metallopeptidase [Luteolibacter pohnpeiensis]
MKRIAIGGIAIESCTFSPLTSGIEDFLILRGDEMRVRYDFLTDWKIADHEDITWIPLLQAKAIPGGSVRQDAYEALKQEILTGLRKALPLDGFYLDIHGAMNVVGMDDAEADLARSIREVVGPDCLITTGMDLHGNVTRELVEQVDVFTAYRTAPHIDYMETREKACRMLVDCLDQQIRPVRAWAKIPAGLPGERTSTFTEPGNSIYATLPQSDAREGVLDASLWVGYVWADEPRNAASVVVTGTDPDTCREEALRIARIYWDARKDFQFGVPAFDADTCIAKAVSLEQKAVFISDSGDNPTAGGAGDIPYMVQRLLAHPDIASGKVQCIYASIPSATAVGICQQAGIGNEARVQIGGKLDPVHGQELELTGTVEFLLPDDPIGGDLAVLRVGGVHLILTSKRKPFHVIREFTRLELDPKQVEITAVKIGYLEPELHETASQAFLALTPGAVNQDIPQLSYQRVARPWFPLDVDFDPGDFNVAVIS